MDVAACSKCQEPLDTAGYPKWCKSCRAKYKRGYEDAKEKLTFGEGVAAMRDVLADEFERLGTGSFQAYECADLIRRAPGPILD